MSRAFIYVLLCLFVATQSLSPSSCLAQTNTQLADQSMGIQHKEVQRAILLFKQQKFREAEKCHVGRTRKTSGTASG